ncbi:UMF1 family MFS transporter [Ulvibacter sp. MAR_2010_11]|uniref:MFS transporter n=1 Tax=Ulvibacter sp. MAR_2010_11 TaxID=1250229 RepID=UPI000C2CDC46|nr:MFS transporter [Ulvibacter sp. MAR_2010_11]PKA84297.1 UMF1 family MFS transporter [Ulvibacter sp. MAR_2010_11]
MGNLEKGSKKLLNAWAFYDWANSVYSLVIASAVFPIYYQALFNSANVDSVVVFGGIIRSTPLISYTTAAAFLLVSIMSPLLSGIADYVGNKKVFMKFFCYLGALSCIGLYFFDLEAIHTSLLFYFLGLVGFWGSLVFYNSYLPDVAFTEQQDRISARGYSLGYIGSVLLLIFNLLMVMKPNLFGLGEGGEASMKAMRISFVSVGVWWIGFSQYSFYHLPKGVSTGHKVTRKVIFNGFKELKGVYQSLSGNLKLKRYLAAFFVYSMAVQTVMLVATYFGEQEIDWGGADEKTIGLISSILIIQLVAVIGATLTSRSSEKFGNIPTLIVINGIWVLICVVAYFIETPNQFYMTAGVVGLVMGGIQALSRSTYSKFLPETTDTTSYFSFYDVAEKIGIVIGMVIYGVIDQVTGSMRNSILFLVVFFITGVILLFRVPRKNSK